VFVTVNDPQGCAAGIYHEVGHLRLETCGLNIDDHDGRLITNPIEDLFDSPVRKDVKRPMCAVIHGLYAWLMLTENDLWCADRISAADACSYLRPNLPKLREGIVEVERYAQPTVIGDVFLGGMMTWARDIVARGEKVLAAHGG
jgi:HEXXH motif-containing protein